MIIAHVSMIVSFGCGAFQAHFVCCLFVDYYTFSYGLSTVELIRRAALLTRLNAFE